MADVLGGPRRVPPSLEDLPSCAVSVTVDDDAEDVESFWARRASTIQHYYNMWDCNQLTNEAFAVQLQNILGTRVDLNSPDSEFMRLTNQHRYARNLKFAQLMSALRLDARNARNSRNYGEQAGSPQGAGYAPSEAPSETPSYAAGRPSQSQQSSLALGMSMGRKHYPPSESGFDVDDNQSVTGSIRREPKPRTPAPYADLSDIPSKPSLDRGQAAARAPPPFAQDTTSHPTDKLGRPISSSGYANSQGPAPRSPPPFAQGGTFEQGYRRSAQAQPASQQLPLQDPNFWSRREPLQPMNAGNEFRTDGSQCGQSDVMSVADSQREVFTARDRSGHGNILTWGNDSRNLTPHRKRQGRQLAMESDGQPKAHAVSGVFPPSPTSSSPNPLP